MQGNFVILTEKINKCILGKYAKQEGNLVKLEGNSDLLAQVAGK